MSQHGENGNGGDLARELARTMVALFKEYTGRGPTRAKAYIEDDLVVVVLQDTLTKPERSLADDERTDLVEEMRRSFQGAFRDQAVSDVERLVGKPVVAFMSDHDLGPDYAVEVFVLENGD